MQYPATLLTGATGLLGSYLLRDLLARDVMLRMSKVAIARGFGRQTPDLIASGGGGR